MGKTFSNQLKALCQEKYATLEWTKVAEFLAQTHAQSYRHVRKILADLQNPFRQTALEILIAKRDKRAALLVMRIFMDDSDPLSELAMQGLWRGIADHRTLKPLRDMMLAHPDEQSRHQAAIILTWHTGNHRLFGAFLQVLNNSGEAPYIRGQAAEALAYIGKKEAVPSLIAALENEDLILRWDVVFALGGLEDKRALPILEHLAATDQRSLHFVTNENRTLAQDAADAIAQIKSRQP